MRFTWEQLKFMFQEIRRVLKNDGFNFFSVRNYNDKSYGQGKNIDNDIYDINGFQIRFFTKEHVRALVKGKDSKGICRLFVMLFSFMSLKFS